MLLLFITIQYLDVFFTTFLYGAKDGDENVEIGRCLQSVGAVKVDTRDAIFL